MPFSLKKTLTKVMNSIILYVKSIKTFSNHLHSWRKLLWTIHSWDSSVSTVSTIFMPYKNTGNKWRRTKISINRWLLSIVWHPILFPTTIHFVEPIIFWHNKGGDILLLLSITLYLTYDHNSGVISPHCLQQIYFENESSFRDMTVVIVL